MNIAEINERLAQANKHSPRHYDAPQHHTLGKYSGRQRTHRVLTSIDDQMIPAQMLLGQESTIGPSVRRTAYLGLADQLHLRAVILGQGALGAGSNGAAIAGQREQSGLIDL
jgi:hypothetical protein